jgi:hypothetical protein
MFYRLLGSLGFYLGHEYTNRSTARIRACFEPKNLSFVSTDAVEGRPYSAGRRPQRSTARNRASVASFGWVVPPFIDPLLVPACELNHGFEQKIGHHMEPVACLALAPERSGAGLTGHDERRLGPSLYRSGSCQIYDPG